MVILLSATLLAAVYLDKEELHNLHVLKFIHVVDNDTSMHAVHTCTVAFNTLIWSCVLSVSTRGFVDAWCKVAGSAQLRTSGGPGNLLEVLLVLLGRRRSSCATSSWGGAMTTTMEQVVTQLQQELVTIRAQIASIQMAEEVRVSDNFATA